MEMSAHLLPQTTIRTIPRRKSGGNFSRVIAENPPHQDPDTTLVNRFVIKNETPRDHKLK